MRKLKLDLDSLVVQSFATEAAAGAGGTVDARAATFQCGGTANCTAATCAVNDTCAYVSCGDIFCGTLRCGGDSYVPTCDFVYCGASGGTSCIAPCYYTCDGAITCKGDTCIATCQGQATCAATCPETCPATCGMNTNCGPWICA